MRGAWLLEIHGIVMGDVERIRFAVREGAYTLEETEMAADSASWQTVINAEGGRGDLYLLGLIEGDGALRITAIEWLPWSLSWAEPH